MTNTAARLAFLVLLLASWASGVSAAPKAKKTPAPTISPAISSAIFPAIEKTLKGPEPEHPRLLLDRAGLPRDRHWKGGEVVTMRSDPKALFVGVQAGSNRVNHNHLSRE